jgi:sugar O-acyltransferase (sialic acid O-acetyltransferase NeuD family)
VVAVFDDTPALPSPFRDVEIYYGWQAFKKWIKAQPDRKAIGFCISIGNPHGRVRLKFQELLMAEGLTPLSVIHPSAVIAPDVVLGKGVQIMAGVVIQSEAKIGDQCIINTGASVDHEDILEAGVEVGPGATLCGNVHVKMNGWVAAGAVVLPRITIGEDSLAGAGAIVTKDIPDGVVAYGSPARVIRKVEKRKN